VAPPPPFVIIRPPAAVASPVLFDSPHSGRHYPPDWPTRASHAELRWGEDAYVDELVTPAAPLGVTVLCATFPRCYIDLNRAEDDLDAELLAEPWPAPLAPTEKSRRGLGLVRRYIVPGVEVNARLLTVAEVQQRIDAIHRPYHASLDALVAEIRDRHGCVLHVDWHSMKAQGNAMTPDGAGARRPDFVVSDRDGTSAAPALTAFIVDRLRHRGYRVSVNDPYRGGAIVQRVGRPADRIHSVQVEVSRALYLDQQRTEKTPGFADLRDAVLQLARQLAADGSGVI
jgi:N-formylglutamate amidohydrolase